MRVVDRAGELPDALAAARREAAAAFGDDTLLVERYVAARATSRCRCSPTRTATSIHLGERECSLQRRHQKIIEEAPSPLLDDRRRGRRWAARPSRRPRAASATPAPARSSSSSPATAPDEFFFMEMNTRLQVEHPVTELVTGLDLVE